MPPCCFLLCLSLQLVIGHGDNGEDQVDQIEGTEEDVEDEEEDVHRSSRHQGDLKYVISLPALLQNEPGINSPKSPGSSVERHKGKR